MKIQVRRLGGGLSDVQMKVENMVIDLGWLNESECAALATELREAANDLAPQQEQHGDAA